MPDREKVIRGLEMCSITPSDRVHCHKCPYNNGISIGCMVELMKDALALLREQAERIQFLEKWTAYLEGGDPYEEMGVISHD